MVDKKLTKKCGTNEHKNIPGGYNNKRNGSATVEQNLIQSGRKWDGRVQLNMKWQNWLQAQFRKRKKNKKA